MSANNLIKTVRQTIHRYQLLKSRETVIVGVSGGPDSVSLLHLLYELRQELGIHLHVAHVNHQLRKTADRDEQFVQALTHKLELKSTITKIKIPKGKGSLEELAREARFQALFKTAKNNDAHVIALGHTQDDLAETVLMRIIRGTGLKGLQSILPQRRFGSYRVIRPLLDISRQAIEKYLHFKKIPYRTDPTNAHMRFFRNKIRAELLPFLQSRYNPQIKEMLANLAKSTFLDYDFLYCEGQRHFHQLAKEITPKSICFKLYLFLKLHPSIQRMVLRAAIEHLKGSTKRLTLTHVENIEMLLGQTRQGSLNLPYNISLEVKAPYLFVRV